MGIKFSNTNLYLSLVFQFQLPTLIAGFKTKTVLPVFIFISIVLETIFSLDFKSYGKDETSKYSCRWKIF